jgi:glycine rich protein
LCVLAGRGRTARCHVTYTPTAVGPRRHTITAGYTGDGAHSGSSAATTVIVAEGRPHCSRSGNTVTCTFGYTGAAQTWTVPSGVTSATVDVQGAQGGSIDDFTLGGLGGDATADLALSPGATVTLVVGGQGGSLASCFDEQFPAGGFNGGGAGATAGCPGAGGGGGSDVRIGGPALANRILVAGGGGGAADGEGRVCGAADGGAGGGLTGEDGIDATCRGYGGSGGNQSGTSGSGELGVGSAGTGSTAGSGGGGGGGYYGGSGGGGYGGGGGGGYGGGGGGSGFSPAGTSFQTGVHSGNGVITVSYLVPLPTSKDQCENGGWRGFGTTFKNQGDCASFAATGGKNQPSGS